MTMDDQALPDGLDEFDPELVEARILCTQTAVAFPYSALTCLALGLSLRDVAPQTLLLGWMAAVLLLTCLRYLVLRPHCPPSSARGARWLICFAVSILISGILWGLAPVLLVPYSHQNPVQFTLYSGLALLVNCGLVAATVASYSVSRCVLFLFSAPALVPPSIYVIATGDRYNTAMGGFVLLYFAFIMSASMRLHVELMRLVDIARESRQLRSRMDGSTGRRPGSRTA